MKITKRLAAFFAAVAMVVLLIPGAAFATGATPTATPAPTATAELAATKPASVTSCDSYSIGTLDGTTFTASTTVSLYTSNLTMRVYFSGTASDGYESRSVSLKAVNNHNYFVGQSPKAIFHSGNMYFDIVGLKYNDDSGNGFLAAVDGCTKDVSFNIGECQVKTAVVTEPTAAPTAAPTATPAPAVASGLIVKSSSIGTDSVNAGDDFTLSLTIYATTSGNTAANDVVVAVTPDKGVVIASGSSTQYIGTLKPGASKTVSFPMRAQADFTEGVSVVAVSVTGTGADGTGALSSSTNVSVPVLQADRFEISNVEVPQSLMVGEEGTATFTFVNKGKNPVGNLTFALACDNIQEASQNQYVGNLAAGTEDSVDFSLIPLAAGQLSGTVTVTYEAPGGKTVTLTQQLNATVEESYVDSGMTGGDSGMVDPSMGGDVAPAGLPGWAVGLIVVGSLAAVVIVVVIVRKQKAKKKAKLEAEDEDL